MFRKKFKKSKGVAPRPMTNSEAVGHVANMPDHSTLNGREALQYLLKMPNHLSRQALPSGKKEVKRQPSTPLPSAPEGAQVLNTPEKQLTAEAQRLDQLIARHNHGECGKVVGFMKLLHSLNQLQLDFMKSGGTISPFQLMGIKRDDLIPAYFHLLCGWVNEDLRDNSKLLPLIENDDLFMNILASDVLKVGETADDQLVAKLSHMNQVFHYFSHLSNDANPSLRALFDIINQLRNEGRLNAQQFKIEWLKQNLEGALNDWNEDIPRVGELMQQINQ